MVVFPIVIIISIVLYVYYKVMILRGSDPLIQEILNAKARISLGIFISFFWSKSILILSNKNRFICCNRLFDIWSATNVYRYKKIPAL